MNESNNDLVKNGMNASLKIALTSVMTVVVCITTMMFSVYLPSSNGFFNIGESMVYISAILFGPYVGAISGGAGSMLADLLLGYPQYALGTLIIKGIEGLVVGYFYSKVKELKLTDWTWTILTNFIGLFIGIAIILIGFVYYQGLAYIGGYIGETPIWEISAELNMIVWIIIGIIGSVSIIVIGSKFKQDTGLKIISMIIGGVIIVIGYLLYSTFVLSYPGAFTEIPFNFLQSLIGIVIAVPTISALEKYGEYVTFIPSR